MVRLGSSSLAKRCTAILPMLCILASCGERIPLWCFVDHCVPVDKPFDECAQYRAPAEDALATGNSNVAKWSYIAAAMTLTTDGFPWMYLQKLLKEILAVDPAIHPFLGEALGYRLEAARRSGVEQNITTVIYEDSRSMYREIEELRTSLEKLNACRVRQIRSLEELVASHTLDRASAQARLGDIRRWVAEDSKLVADVTGLTEKLAVTYMGAHATVTAPGQRSAVVAEWRNYEPAVSGGRVGRAASRFSELPVVEARSRQIQDPIRRMAYAQKELKVEAAAQKEVVDRELADLEASIASGSRPPAAR